MTSEVEAFQVIIRGEDICQTPAEIIQSSIFRRILQRFVKRLVRKNSVLLKVLAPFRVPDTQNQYDYDRLVEFFLALSEKGLSQVAVQVGIYEITAEDRLLYRELVESLYDFWRQHQRFLVCDETGDTRSMLQRHEAFLELTEHLKRLVLQTYRTIVANLQGKIPLVYRQLPAGGGVGLAVRQLDWNLLPPPYDQLANIPFIQTAVIDPPLVYYPKRNLRQGMFEPVDFNPLQNTRIDAEEFLCYPAKVGPLLMFVYFHKRYLALGVSLANLFELAERMEVVGTRPDAILVFGVDASDLGEHQTVYYEDTKNDVLLGVIGRTEDVDYFGYFKKMMLTLHNVIMINRGKLPIHGAMAHISLKNGAEANVVLVGDSGAGKSESLEAFRVLADDYIRELIIVFDDMGSLGMTRDGKIYGMGTEIGAFVRLDDLEPGFAYREFERSIFMNPHRTNARVVIPVTTYENVIKRWHVDLFLYANNYEQVTNPHGYVELFDDPEVAVDVFSRGARLSKGTTDEQGLVNTYFANPFGAIQKRQQHEQIARQYITQMMKTGVKVGQLRTQLGLPGMEQQGPEDAAKALFEFITKNLLEGESKE